MVWTRSIRVQVVLLLSAFVMLVCAVAAVSTFGVLAIDRHTSRINHKWLTGTHLLGELGDHVSQFRLAETLFALAPDLSSARKAKTLAEGHRDAIDRIARRYVAVIGSSQIEADLAAFMEPWHDYVAMHEAWIASIDAMEAASLSSTGGAHLDTSYKTADAAVAALINANASAALQETLAADRVTDNVMKGVYLCSALAIALALLIALLFQRYIIAPLKVITLAMGHLAAGSRDVHLPPMRRIDEITNLAKAFEVFRANLFALEHAHEQTRCAQETAQTLARHDALTGLPNRRVFSNELASAVSGARQGLSNHALILIDLDRFKSVNDSRGHSVGDRVLCEVAHRLGDLGNGRVARLGGDEFALMFAVSARDRLEIEAIEMVERIQHTIREPIIFDDFSIEIGSSIGIARCSGEVDSEALLRRADIAMYHAKNNGRDTFRLFEQDMDEVLKSQALAEENLRKAVRDGEIVPYFQPLIDLRSGRICGFEILARWQTALGIFVPPSSFIPLAERLNIIHALTLSLLREACVGARDWPSDIRLALNISPLQLMDPILPLHILSILNAAGIAPHRLEIEVTESALIADFEAANQNFRAFQSVGITIALDDFGTGYSSLQHLARFQFDKLKIDRSFIETIETNGESEKIVTAVLSLAKSLGLPTVAEGIESQAVLDRIVTMGCDFGQGHLFGRAVDATTAGSLLRASHGSFLAKAS